MRIVVTGSIATDHLMAYPGRFADHLVDGHLERVSLSFLADTLEVRRGGVAANIAIGLGRLGLRPLLAGAAGHDFAEYRHWLEANGVDTRLTHVSDTLHTARFVCTTDADQNQIATFYPGAMGEARGITLTPHAHRTGGVDLVVISPNDPEAMLRHTEECRSLNIPFAADPSQQLARLDRGQARRLIDGARWLFTNEYESALLRQLTGWSGDEVLERVGAWITTRGPEGATVARPGQPPLHICAVPVPSPVDPTGVGDAFRAGFLAGAAWQWPYERAARLGCALAAVVLETVGTQEYKLSAADLLLRLEQGYGAPAAAEIAPDLQRIGV
ncbi:carbohydrate kinase family protein [Streptomyces sp. SS8]